VAPKGFVSLEIEVVIVFTQLAPHAPFSHVPVVPHVVPLATVLAKTHSCWPVEQEVAPFVHGLPVEHAEPAVHATQDPPSQTSFVPHDRPLAALLPESSQTGTPDEQSVDPA
jgi:hypothetical protein